METYSEILTDVIITISKMYAAISALLIIALIVCLLLKKKFNTKYPILVITVIFLCELASYLILAVPRVVDLKNDTYITVENATLILDPTNNNPKGSNVLFWGYAYIMPENGKSTQVCGVDYFDLTEINKLDPEEYCYDIVYAEHSRQLIAMEKHSEN